MLEQLRKWEDKDGGKAEAAAAAVAGAQWKETEEAKLRQEYAAAMKVGGWVCEWVGV